MFKRAFEFAWGAARITMEKTEQFLEEIEVRKGINREEAKNFVNDALKKGEEEYQIFKDKLREGCQEHYNRACGVSRSEIETLEARIKELEKKLAAEEAD
ncbi:MAG: hypothetical protein LBR98_04635 [Syntrophomonadaceae bacterium]|jgi:polyhydroxyalkanoate synthesis regulator phasin|nr:hypothetical protein [Syntrophomonadaceae bacterium]